ncbi:MAG: hypothetical protein ACX94C_15405 [Phycisphaerales bacterium]
MHHAQLTPDIIHDLIIEPLPTLDICLKHQLSVEQLHTLVTSDEFKELADQLNEINHVRAPFIRARMLEVLNRIANLAPQSPTHTETIRKAAAQLLRITEPPKQGAETRAEDDPQPDNHPPDHDKQHKRAPGRNAEAQYDPHHQKQQAQNQRDGPIPDQISEGD